MSPLVIAEPERREAREAPFGRGAAADTAKPLPAGGGGGGGGGPDILRERRGRGIGNKGKDKADLDRSSTSTKCSKGCLGRCDFPFTQAAA